MKEAVPGMSEKVEHRMRDLGLTPGSFAEAADLTTEALRPVRAGVRKRYQAVTIYGVAKALAWAPDWYDRLLAGGEPVEVEVQQVQTLSEMAREIRLLRELVEEMVARERQRDQAARGTL